MTIKRQAAVLFASNLPATIKYWNEQLGFAVHATFLDPPVFAIMERDGAFMMLKQLAAGDGIKPNAQRAERLWNEYFWVDDVAALFDEIHKRGAPVKYSLYDQPYGVCEFAVRDPDDRFRSGSEYAGRCTPDLNDDKAAATC